MPQQKTLLSIVVSFVLALVLNTSLALAQTAISNGDVVNVPTDQIEISLGDEGMVVNQYGSPIIDLPGALTPAELNGNFSALLPGQQLYDPTNDQPFQWNIIPTSMFPPSGGMFVPFDGSLGINSLTVDGAGSALNVGSSLTINSTGTLTITNGGAVNVGLPAGSVTNSGTVLVGSDSSVTTSANYWVAGGSGAYTQTAGSTKVNGELTAPGGVDIESGTLTGGGTIVGGVDIGDGAMVSPDQMTIDGDLTLDPSSFFDESTFSGSSFGALNVSGTASLDGTLDILLQDGFLPAAGESFLILDAAGGLNGTRFGSIENDTFAGGFWTLLYNNDLGTVTLQAHSTRSVPEPPTWMLLGVALAALGLIVTRKGLLRTCEPRG